MGGTLDSWRLEELEDRCKSKDEDIESDKTAFDSLMPRNLDRAAVVLRIEASRAAESSRLKLFKSFFCSSSRMKSLRLSSSVCGTDPELPPPCPSLIKSDSGCAEDEALCLPLLF
jgi:hypothetical protein